MPVTRTESEQLSDYDQRAERILTAAAELTLSWGYKRVAVDDIAQRAGVGKGTVYLHWRTRDALFDALLLRESVAVQTEMLTYMRSRPDGVLLHRLMPRTFLISMYRPLARAMFTRDIQLLGKLTERGAGAAMHALQVAAQRDYLAQLRGCGLLRTDLDLPAQIYALNATITGFGLIESVVPANPPTTARPALEAKADTMAAILRHAFGPPGRPDPEAVADVAPKVLAIYTNVRAECVRAIQQQAKR